jgi:hypothetical protein
MTSSFSSTKKKLKKITEMKFGIKIYFLKIIRTGHLIAKKDEERK